MLPPRTWQVCFVLFFIKKKLLCLVISLPNLIIKYYFVWITIWLFGCIYSWCLLLRGGEEGKKSKILKRYMSDCVKKAWPDGIRLNKDFTIVVVVQLRKWVTVLTLYLSEVSAKYVHCSLSKMVHFINPSL